MNMPLVSFQAASSLLLKSPLVIRTNDIVPKGFNLLKILAYFFQNSSFLIKTTTDFSQYSALFSQLVKKSNGKILMICSVVILRVLYLVQCITMISLASKHCMNAEQPERIFPGSNKPDIWQTPIHHYSRYIFFFFRL